MKSKNSLPIGHIGIIEAHSWGLLIPQLCVTTVSCVFYVVKKKLEITQLQFNPSILLSSGSGFIIRNWLRFSMTR